MQLKTVHEGKVGAEVTPQKYALVRAAILAALPTAGTGLTWDELVQAIAPGLPPDLFPHLGSVRGYTKAVQLDLEARGLIARVPKTRPLRLLRRPDAGPPG
jgi:hypothetical protein